MNNYKGCVEASWCDLNLRVNVRWLDEWLCDKERQLIARLWLFLHRDEKWSENVGGSRLAGESVMQ